MKKTLLVVGYGPGISSGVAEKFGRQGFHVALVARSQERLDAAVKELAAKDVQASAFVTDVSDPAAVRSLVERVRGSVGPIAAIHWNAYGGAAVPLASATAEQLSTPFTIATTSLLTAVQAALPDLEASKGAVLVTNGGFGFFDPKVDAFAATSSNGPISIANSAKHKLVGVLHHELAPKGVYVVDLVVTGTVRGTAWDRGNATLEPSVIADRFWELHQQRSVATATI